MNKQDWVEFIDYKKVTKQLICENTDKNWDWDKIKIPLDFTLKIIKKFGNVKRWSWGNIFKNKKLTRDFILRYKIKLNHFHSIWYSILDNNPDFIDLYFKLVRKSQRKNDILCMYCKMTYIEKNIDNLNFYQYYKTRYKSFFTTNYIENNQDNLNFIYNDDTNIGMYNRITAISKNKNITEEFVEKHKNWVWNYKLLSNNILFTYEFIRKNKKKDWGRHRIEKMKKHFRKQEAYSFLLCNKTIPDLERLICEYL